MAAKPEHPNRNIYQLALLAQSASNASGLIHSLADEVLPVVWEEAKEKGESTDYVSRHPVLFMFLYQLMFLNGKEPLEMSDRWEECNRVCQERASAP